MTPDLAGLDAKATKAVSLGKDLVALLRDLALFALVLLLVAFPVKFNSLLVNAGFEEGSLVGFKWKSKLIDSNRALEDAQGTISQLQAKNDELARALADANAKLRDPALLTRIARLDQENQQLKSASDQVQSTVSQAIEANAPLVNKALISAAARTEGPRPRSDYQVGLQTVGVPDSARVAINDKLKAEGYGLDAVTWSYPAGERPGWFALRPTVFYYSGSASRAAQELAGVMRAITGQDFVVQRGAGLGVDPSRKDVTLYVHYLKQ